MPSTEAHAKWSIAVLLTALLQTASAAPAKAHWFDFWVGQWTVSWVNPDGSPGRGRNQIRKILEDQVIEEQFEGEAGSTPPALLGRSLTVLQKGAGEWRQAWADNQGGFFAFTGGLDGETRYFATEFKALKGQRMRFYDIQADSFTWDWEGSNDGGKTWTLLWRLHYHRARS
jgi:hypothetical protein